MTYRYIYNIHLHHNIYNIQFVFASPGHHPLDSHPSCLQVGQEMLGSLQAAAEFTLDLIRARGRQKMSGQGRKKNG